MEERGKQAEFYMQNLLLTYLNFWDPSSRLGDMKLMALASWLTREKIRDEEVRKLMENEEKDPLYIIEVLVSSAAVISNHNLISSDSYLAPKYIETQEKSILHF